jgi:hypothetical protein
VPFTDGDLHKEKAISEPGTESPDDGDRDLASCLYTARRFVVVEVPPKARSRLLKAVKARMS